MGTLDDDERERRREDGAGREVQQRLAHAHDTLIHIARHYHLVECHRGASWTDCQEWPCRDVGREITRRIAE